MTRDYHLAGQCLERFHTRDVVGLLAVEAAAPCRKEGRVQIGRIAVDQLRARNGANKAWAPPCTNSTEWSQAKASTACASQWMPIERIAGGLRVISALPPGGPRCRYRAARSAQLAPGKAPTSPSSHLTLQAAPVTRERKTETRNSITPKDHQTNIRANRAPGTTIIRPLSGAGYLTGYGS